MNADPAPCGPHCTCHHPHQGWLAYDRNGQLMAAALDRADIERRSDAAEWHIEPHTLYLSSEVVTSNDI